MKRKIIVSVIILLFFMGFFYYKGIAMSIPEPWIFSTVYIENLSTGVAGTGCLVSRKVSKDSVKVFLVSNKHVLMPKKLKEVGLLREKVKEEKMEAKAKIFLNRLEEGTIKLYKIDITLRDKNGKEYWKSYPSPKIDVAALDFTRYISKDRKLRRALKIGFISEDKFAIKEKLEEEFVSIGDRIIVLGYPLNLVEGGHAIPVARGGIIASYPIHNFRGLPIILIDSTMVRGSSGSPVFLPVLPYKWESKTKMDTISLTQARFLGIVSGTVPDWSMAIMKTISFGQKPQIVSVMDVANLGIIFKAETIKEVIDEFGIPAWKPPAEIKKEKQKPQKAKDQSNN